MLTIAEQNDLFRCLPSAGGHVVTAGIVALGEEAQERILEKVRAYDAFSERNDPYGEHDFGSFKFEGQTIFWKIDYYDLAREYGSPNPADPARTRRVLTVMLAEEY